MATLSQFRQQYPQYDDIPDADLIPRLRAKGIEITPDVTSSPSAASAPQPALSPEPSATPEPEAEDGGVFDRVWSLLKGAGQTAMKASGPGFLHKLATSPHGRSVASREGIAMAGSLGGAAVGGALGGPPGAVVGESVGSGLGYGANVALGLEEPSWANLSLAMAPGPALSGFGRLAKATGLPQYLAKKIPGAGHGLQDYVAEEAPKLAEHFRPRHDPNQLAQALHQKAPGLSIPMRHTERKAAQMVGQEGQALSLADPDELRRFLGVHHDIQVPPHGQLFQGELPFENVWAFLRNANKRSGSRMDAIAPGTEVGRDKGLKSAIFDDLEEAASGRSYAQRDPILSQLGFNPQSKEAMEALTILGGFNESVQRQIASETIEDVAAKGTRLKKFSDDKINPLGQLQQTMKDPLFTERPAVARDLPAAQAKLAELNALPAAPAPGSVAIGFGRLAPRMIMGSATGAALGGATGAAIGTGLSLTPEVIQRLMATPSGRRLVINLYKGETDPTALKGLFQAGRAGLNAEEDPDNDFEAVKGLLLGRDRGARRGGDY